MERVLHLGLTTLGGGVDQKNDGEAHGKAEAGKIAESYKNCPYVNFMATREKELFATFFLPAGQGWWIEYVEKKPKETFGLQKAKVTFVDVVHHPKVLRMRLPRKEEKSLHVGRIVDQTRFMRRVVVQVAQQQCIADMNAGIFYFVCLMSDLTFFTISSIQTPSGSLTKANV